MELVDMTAIACAEKIRRGEISAMEALEAVLSRSRAREDALHCFLTLDEEGARRQAEAIQKKIKSGELTGPLVGVPFAVKDNICTKGLRTTAGSRILENFVPAYDATAMENLRKAGAVLIGKTNMDEFAMGNTSETSFAGAVRNPWQEDRSAGGSSGGSAAAVAAGECFAALGSDTGGSVRQPASHCGVVGLKPTYGTVSRYGLIAYASSMDQIGPITKDVRDSAAVYNAIASHDPKDATSNTRKRDALSYAEGVEGLRVGIPSEFLSESLQPEIAQAVKTAADQLKAAGATVEEFDLGLCNAALPAYYTIACAEASSNLERYDGMKYGLRASGESLSEVYRQTRSQGFGAEVRRRILLGTFALSEGFYEQYYLKALKVRRLVRNDYDRAFERFDVILGPVAPETAPRLGGQTEDPVRAYLADIYTVAANLTGYPAISVPFGRDGQGLTVGIQLSAAAFREDLLFRVGLVLEENHKVVEHYGK
ncbi:MAG: Asp-tRNA(Asn)/Glu-tRNA(Gln) amidotransferase subunit GatA [Acetatifactor sp.]|nr:Asp-tRNA(Asn)/Glu-tRNA(Gln) amidotransferase subunit GatA [Acetatifactor sp.]